MRKKARKVKYQESPVPKVERPIKTVFSTLGYSFLFSYLVDTFTYLLMFVTLNSIYEEGICIHFVQPTFLEFLIPTTACILVACRTIKTRVFQVLRYPVLAIMVTIICLSIVFGIKEILSFFI